MCQAQCYIVSIQTATFLCDPTRYTAPPPPCGAAAPPLTPHTPRRRNRILLRQDTASACLMPRRNSVSSGGDNTTAHPASPSSDIARRKQTRLARKLGASRFVGGFLWFRLSFAWGATPGNGHHRHLAIGRLCDIGTRQTCRAAATVNYKLRQASQKKFIEYRST